MKLSVISCGKAPERSGPFNIVLGVDSEDGKVGETVSATLTERTTGPLFQQFGPIVAELVEQLVARLNEKLTAPPIAAKVLREETDK